MEDRALRRGLSIAAIVLVAFLAFLLSFNDAHGIVFGEDSTIYGLPFIYACAIPLLAILILLTRYCTNTDTVGEMIASIGVRYCLFGWCFIFVIKTAAILLNVFCYDFFNANYETIYLLMNSFNVCVVGTVVLTLALRKLPKCNIEKKKLKFGQLFLLILIMYGLTHIGMLMGLPIHLILSSISLDTDVNSNTLSELLNGSNIVVTIITVGILPPIFEELLFRKFLIDRTLRHGEFISCAMSGIMFGLWHGNFQQFFFAFFIGVLFAFVYIRTGNIIYTMILHASMNLVTTGITLPLMYALLDKIGIDGEDIDTMSNSDVLTKVFPLLFAILCWLLIYFAFQIAGFIVFMVKRKNFKLALIVGELPRKTLLRILTHSPEMWIFFSMALMLFVRSYAPDIISVFLSN